VADTQGGLVALDLETGTRLWSEGAGPGRQRDLSPTALLADERAVEILDGDEVRTYLSKGLGFSKEDRDTNIMRIGFVANLLTRNGVATICCPISPYKETRDANRELIGEFVEVYVHATIEELAENRDPKGLYKKARAGQIPEFTGISAPYEEPHKPEVVLDTNGQSVDQSVAALVAYLQKNGYLG